MNTPTKKLNSRASIPVIGYGTARLEEKELQSSLLDALEIGYRHIDTADYNKNHKIIGKTWTSSGIKRNELFITTKIWKTDLSKERVHEVVKRSLDELKSDYIDLLLIHAPNDEVAISETLEAMRNNLENNEVSAIGISNFNKIQTNQVVEVQKHWKTDFKVVNNQIEYHPTKQQKELARTCFRHDISVTAYSPLGNGTDLNKYQVRDLLRKYDKSEAQIILRWLVQLGLIVIPSSSKRSHIKENFELFDWEIEEEDMQILNNIFNS